MIETTKTKKCLIIHFFILFLIFFKFLPMLHESSPEAAAKYTKLVNVIHDINTLKQVTIINFGEVEYYDTDVSAFCRFFSDNDKISETIKQELLEKKWILLVDTSKDKVLKKDGNKIRISFIQTPDEKDRYSLEITDIRSSRTKSKYKDDEHLKYLLDEI